MQRGPVDVFRVDGPVRADTGLAERPVEVLVIALAVVGRADIESLSCRRDLQYIEARAMHGLGDGPESEARTGTDQPPLLQHFGRHVLGQPVVVHPTRIAQGWGGILARDLANTGRELKHPLPVTLG